MAGLRVTLTNQFYTPDVSPTAHLCASLAQHRAARGDRVTVLTSRAGYLATFNNGAGNPRDNRTGERGVHVRRLWSTRFGSRSKLGRLLDWVTFYIPAFYAAATLPRQDVVICLTTPPFIALAGWLHKLIHPTTRLILWNMDVYPEALERTGLTARDSLVSRLMRSAHRALFMRLDHLICLDGAMAHLLVSQYTPPGRMVPNSIIPNWESLDLFPDGGTDKQDSVAKLDNRNERQSLRRTSETGVTGLVILYLGNAGYGHEFQTLIDAADLLRNEPVTFRFIGGGALRPWIEAAARRRNLRNIVLEDYVPKDQTPAVMRQADLALITLENPMLGVMSPSKLHANLAMGLPILYVGPAGSNVDEAISRFGCGISLRPGQTAELADFACAMLRDPQALAAIRSKARLAFEQAYCDRVTLPAFDALLDSAG